jgi:hypothetical protein
MLQESSGYQQNWLVFESLLGVTLGSETDFVIFVIPAGEMFV